MGDALAAAKDPGAITFAQDDSGKSWEILPGVSATVYVRLCEDGQLIQLPWLDKSAPLNLWAHFTNDPDQRMGLDFWVEASGAQINLRAHDKLDAWNSASKRHAQKATEFEEAVAAWVRLRACGR